MNNSIQHHPERNQFTLPLDQGVAKIDYSVRDGVFYLDHSEVPFALRGQGIGKILVDKTFQYLADNNIKAVSRCSYIRAVAQRNPMWAQFV